MKESPWEIRLHAGSRPPRGPVEPVKPNLPGVAQSIGDRPAMSQHVPLPDFTTSSVRELRKRIVRCEYAKGCITP